MNFNWDSWNKLRDSNLDTTFRQWVLIFKNDLEIISNYLDNLESEAKVLDAFSFSQYEKEVITNVSDYLIRALDMRMEALEKIVKDFSEADHKHHREFLKLHLWNLVGKSPLLHRAQTKPLGYAGDYEMMNMLYRDHSEGKSFFGKVMNIVAANLPVAQANINRIEFLIKLINNTIERFPDPNIISVGSGPAKEVETYFKKYFRPINISLFDQEPHAIDQCKRNISPIVTHN